MKTFYVGIKGVIVKDGKVLLVRSNADNQRRDIWEMPGGRIEGSETIEQTLERELKEELPNIKNIEIFEVLDACRLPWDIDGDKSLALVFYRVSADFDGDPKLSDEHIDWKWLQEKEALKLAHKNCHAAIKRALTKT